MQPGDRNGILYSISATTSIVAIQYIIDLTSEWHRSLYTNPIFLLGFWAGCFGPVWLVHELYRWVILKIRDVGSEAISFLGPIASGLLCGPFVFSLLYFINPDVEEQWWLACLIFFVPIAVGFEVILFAIKMRKRRELTHP